MLRAKMSQKFDTELRVKLSTINRMLFYHVKKLIMYLVDHL